VYDQRFGTVLMLVVFSIVIDDPDSKYCRTKDVGKVDGQISELALVSDGYHSHFLLTVKHIH